MNIREKWKRKQYLRFLTNAFQYKTGPQSNPSLLIPHPPPIKEGLVNDLVVSASGLHLAFLAPATTLLFAYSIPGNRTPYSISICLYPAISFQSNFPKLNASISIYIWMLNQFHTEINKTHQLDRQWKL